MKMNRTVKQRRNLYKKVLILCEGLTEKNYLVSAKNSLPRELQKGVKIEIDNYKKTDLKSLILEAIKRKKTAKKQGSPYNNIWIVFDNDNLPNRDFAFEHAKKNQIEIAYNSMCIELWFIIHFEDSLKKFANGNEAKQYLIKNHINQYNPGKTNIWEILDKNQLEKAYKNANHIRKSAKNEIAIGKNIWELNPYTNMDVLLDFLFQKTIKH